MKKALFRFGLLIIALAIATPLGLIASGDAWGEWSADTIKNMLGFVPEGIKKFSSLWNAPFSDYSLKGLNDITGYILSALIGVALLIGLFFVLSKITSRNKT